MVGGHQSGRGVKFAKLVRGSSVGWVYESGRGQNLGKWQGGYRTCMGVIESDRGSKYGENGRGVKMEVLGVGKKS